jgi:beta-mannosidase
VRLEVTIQVECKAGVEFFAKVLVQYRDRTVSSAEKSFRGKQATLSLEIENPHLWWPNGMGEQALYEVTVDLLDRDDELLDTCTKRIGLRTLELVRKKDKWGESFYFSVNGVPFFAKGANWIPADALVPRVSVDRYRRLLESAVSANMNMLRVWGGGIYEDDEFYNLCDELGICIWQDFMFACATYPTFDKRFMENVRQEAVDNIRRLRHHPCLALWCGNNELEQGLVGKKWTARTMSWRDYSRLFDKLLPSLVRKLDPDRPYWPGSPHSPYGKREDYNNPRWGDAHLWEVWHGQKPLQWYRTCFHRFCSEFGFQSFPEPKTVNSYITAGERNITNPVMEHHQRHWRGNALIIQYMLDWFRMPKNFESILWLSQILQSIGIKYGAEHWRRNMPRCMGALYWQLNDCWPVASWSSIDYYLRWKALHYTARRFFAPVLISGTVENDKIDLFVTNDKLQPFSGRAECVITTVKGEVIDKYSYNVRIPSRTSREIKRIDVSHLTKKVGADNLLIWLSLYENNKVVSSNLVLFAKPKQLELVSPGFIYTVSKSKARGRTNPGFIISIKSKYPALWVWFELRNMDAQFSDNFFHMMPGKTYRVEVQPAKKVSISELQGALKIRSLIDTYK